MILIRLFLYSVLLIFAATNCSHFKWEKEKEPKENKTAAVLPAPAFSLAAGIYSSAQSVTISPVIAGALVCYSTNGANPDCDSNTPTCLTSAATPNPVTISSTTTIKSLSCKPGYGNSAIATQTYTIDAPPGAVVVFSANAGDGEILLNWTNPADADLAKVRILRRAGSPPTLLAYDAIVFDAMGSTHNDTGLANGTTYFYAAVAYDLAGSASTLVAANATPAAGAVNAPVLSPAPGTFNAAQSVALSSSTPGSIICYGTGAVTPACDAAPACTGGSVYSGPFSVAASDTVRAIACKAGPNTSALTVGNYTIDGTPPTITAVAPTNNSSVNSALVSYTLSETCSSASIRWNRTGGTADTGAPHTKALTATEMTAGAHNAVLLVNSPTLVNGTSYSISYDCTDVAGNAAATVTSTSITFDPAPPANVSALRAIPGNGRVTLAWSNPADIDFAGVKILRKTGSYPSDANDGTVVYSNNGTNATDNALTNGTAYFYRAFAYDTGGNTAGGVNASAAPFAPCGGGNCRIFVTSNTAKGNLGSVAGADALCNADAAKPNGSVYKALLADTTSRRACTAANCSAATGVEQSLDWPLYPGVAYVQTDGVTVIGTTSSLALLPGTLANVVAGGGSQAWTGLNADWTSGSETCNNWTDATSGFSGIRGNANSTTSAAWSNSTNPCVTARALYCVEQ